LARERDYTSTGARVMQLDEQGGYSEPYIKNVQRSFADTVVKGISVKRRHSGCAWDVGSWGGESSDRS